MKDINELHRKAMRWAEQAATRRRKGDFDKVNSLLEKALAAGRQAATHCDPKLEPTRSVLHRSAATLALQCNQLHDAEVLVTEGLAGNPPAEIAEELHTLMKQIRKSAKQRIHADVS